MTLSAEDPRQLYTGDGVTTTFSYTFTVESADDIQVWVDGAPGAGFVIDTAIKNVVFDDAPASGDVVEISRVLEFEQNTDLDPYGEFQAQTVENALDRQVQYDQQLAERLDATLGYDPVGNVNPNWDAKGLRIINVADPVDSQDAMTLAFLQGSGGGLGLDGPVGPPGPPGFGEVVDSSADIGSITSPLDGMVAHVTDPYEFGTFYFSETEVRAPVAGMIVYPSDGTPGAWVRGYNGAAQAAWFGVRFSGVEGQDVADENTVDSGQQMQAAIDWCVANDDPLCIGFKDVYLGTTKLTLSSRLQMYGVERRGTRLWTDQPNRMLEHTRTSSYTGQFNLRNLRFDGTGVSDGIFIDSINYSVFSNVEFREFKAAYINNCEDLQLDNFTVHGCGEEYVTGDTGTAGAGSDQLAVTPSGAAPEFNPNDFVTIAGAGEGGAPLETIIRTIVGNTITTAHSMVTAVTNAQLTRGRAGVMFGDQLANGTSGICNSIVIHGNSTFERCHFHAVASFRSRSLKFVGSKFHGVTENDDPSAPAHDLLVLDRCEVPIVTANQFVHIRRSAIRILRSGGTNDITFNVVSNQFDRPANYADGQDLKVVQILHGMGRVGENTFNDNLNHASYATYGIDIYLGPNHLGVGGRNTHRGLPSSVVTNNAPERSQPRHLRVTSGGENRGGFTYYTWTPALTGASHTVQDARYYRDGNSIAFQGRVTIDSKGTLSGSISIDGLPYASDNTLTATTESLVNVRAEAGYTDALTASHGVYGVIPAGGTSIQLWESGSGEAAHRVQATDFGDATSFLFSGTYTVQP